MVQQLLRRELASRTLQMDITYINDKDIAILYLVAIIVRSTYLDIYSLLQTIFDAWALSKV